MAYKFPWTNYHELNLDWILNTVKELFAKTEQNNAIVEQYDGRLTEVELTADNAQTAAEQAQQNSTAALDLAQGAQTTATQAQRAAAQAQQAAGQAQTAAGQAQEAAATAQQTATQAQQTAQNFDGRIRQAEDNAASALQAAQAFDEQVQGAITAANNANEAATAALTTSAETARELAAQRDTLEGIVSDGVDSLQEAAQDATTEIETVGQSVLNSIPADYTTLSELVDKKADVIYNTAAGDIASFNDGADNMKIKSLIVNIEPLQAGSGEPSPTNIRPISGRTMANIYHETAYDVDANPAISIVFPTEAGIVYGGILDVINGVLTVNKAIADLGAFTWNRNAARGGKYRMQTNALASVIKPPSANNIPANIICSMYKTIAANDVYGRTTGIGVYFSGDVAVYDEDYSDGTNASISAFNSAMSGVHLCYELATPIEYQLTPQQVETLYQYNNIWSDAGSVDVEYPADTKTYIDNKFAELQALILEH